MSLVSTPSRGRALRAIIIYDTDKQCLDMLKKDSRTEKFPILSAITSEEALAQLESPYHWVAAFFFNPAMPTREWVELLKKIRTARPTLPIFMILEPGASSKLRGIDIRKFGIREAREKPVDYSTLLELVRPALLSFDAEEALQKARQSSAASPSKQPSTQDTDYSAIRAEDFLSGSKSYFDVFVRLSSGRYIKLLQAGDNFEAERVETYLRKGVTHFYIQRQVQETYLSYTSHLATTLVRHKVAPPEVKAAQIMNQGEQTLSFLRSSGLKQTDLLFASQFASNLAEFTKQLNLSASPLFHGFMNSVAAYDHGVGTSIIAGLLARELEITHQRMVELVGMAALLHDIGMLGLPDSIKHENESGMTSEERKIFETHAERGASAIATMKGIDSAVVQAVRQHHMRREGKGFPSRPSSQRISMIAEIVGAASEFAYIIARTTEDRDFRPLLEMEERILPLFSTNVAAGFRRSFLDRAAQL